MAPKLLLLPVLVLVAVCCSLDVAARELQHEHHHHDHHHSSSSPFDFIKKLQGCHRGNNTKGILDVKKYLETFGYLEYKHKLHADDDYFDRALAAAIRRYQRNYDLRPTGQLDADTVAAMVRPRCGCADIINGTNFMQHTNTSTVHGRVASFSFFPGTPRWPPSKTLLTYMYLSNVPADAIPAIDRAFQTWAAATRFSFLRVEAGGDISIDFATFEHGDGNPFDGPGGVLAHAFAPTDGRMHHDASETWSIGLDATAFHLETVAAHEIGHLLGLRHSSVPDALMYPTVSRGQIRGLHEDDIQGIRVLYGS